MATLIWRGDADAVAQVSTATPANVEVDDIFTLTCGGTSVSFTATVADEANVTAGLTAAWNASTAPELAEITATDSTTHVTLTGDTAGVQFTVTGSAVNGGVVDTQTLSMATPTAAAGPNVWSTAANWSTGAIPVDDDDIIIEDSDVDILYGLDQSAITADSLTIKASYTGQIGLAETNSDGSTSYVEYRDTHLKISPDVIDIGEGDGDGSAMIKLDAGTVQTALTVYKTGTAAEENYGAVQFIGTHASNTVTVQRGHVGIATQGGQTATVATLKVAYINSVNSDSQVECGSGVTLTTISQMGGKLAVDSNITTLTVDGGEFTAKGTTAIASATVESGKFYHQSSGTITALIVSSAGIADFSRNVAARTVTSTSVYSGASILDPFKTVNWENGLDAVHCDPFREASLQLGKHYTLTPSAI